MKKVIIIAFFSIAIFMISCKTTSTSTSSSGTTAKLSKTLTTLSQSNWHLFSLGTQKVNAPEGGSIPTISFDPQNMTVSGNSGCNTFSGSFKAEKDALSLGNLASTRMMCPDMKMETNFLSSIANTNNFSIYNGKLVLNDISGRQLMSFDPIAK